MAKFKNDAGEEVEALTADEVTAKVKEASEAAAAKAIEDYKKANPAKTPEEIAADKKAADDKAKADAEPIAKLTKDLAEVSSKLRGKEIADLARTYAKGDVDKQKSFTEMFGRLTGFENTPEGMIAQAEAAAGAVGINVKSVNVGDVSGTGAGRNVDAAGKPVTSEADKAIQAALGIKPEDAVKYAPKVEGAA